MTLQEQYNLIKKGKGHKGVFLNEAKLRYPNLLRPAATYEEAVKTLNSKNIIKENIYYPQVLGNEGGTQKESWELKFRSFLNEEEENIKADAKKTDKSVEDALANAYDSSDLENLDNVSFQQLLKGVYFEAQQTPDKSLEDLIKIVGKNLAKDQLHYVKNGQFGMDGVGYETQKSDEVSGKSASSGFGEKTIDKKEPEELKESLNEKNDGQITWAYDYRNDDDEKEETEAERKNRLKWQDRDARDDEEWKERMADRMMEEETLDDMDVKEGIDIYGEDEDGEKTLDIEKIKNTIESNPRFEEFKEWPNWMEKFQEYLDELGHGFSPEDGYDDITSEDLIDDALAYIENSQDGEGEELNESEDDGINQGGEDPGDGPNPWEDPNYGFTDDDEDGENEIPMEEEEQEEPKKTTKVKKETLETRLAAIEREGAAVTLEAKIQHLQTEMDTKNERLNMIGENQDLADLVDGKKLKEMQREIKVLGKRNDKLKKMYEKMTGKAYVQQEIVDEAEDGVEEGKAKTYDEKLADDDKKRKGFTPQKVETGKPRSPIQERRLFRRK